MSGYEEQLHARAKELDETSELASALAGIHAGAAAAGVDRQAVTSLEAALAVLGHGMPGYHAGSREDQHPGSSFHSDAEFLEALSDADDQTGDWLHAAGLLHDQVSNALEQAQRDLEQARRDLAAAYATPTRKPCDGCHHARAVAIAAAETAIAATQRRIAICESTTEILEALTGQLTAAQARLRQVPHDLGEVYELIHEFIRSGGQMPHAGRWVTGTSLNE